MAKWTFVKISFYMPSTFMVTVALVSRFLSPNWLFLAISRNKVLMQDANAAANMFSGVQ